MKKLISLTIIAIGLMTTFNVFANDWEETEDAMEKIDWREIELKQQLSNWMDQEETKTNTTQSTNGCYLLDMCADTTPTCASGYEYKKHWGFCLKGGGWTPPRAVPLYQCCPR